VSEVPFVKVEAIGNDFPLIHETDTLGDLPALAIAMSDRHFGVGGDGLLTVKQENDAVRLRMFNPDGTEDFCGNGIRCAARYVRDLGWVGDEFTLLHLNRVVPVRVAGSLISTEIGRASYRAEDVPTAAIGELFNSTIWSGMDAGMPISLFGSALTTGSTHVVIPTISLPDSATFASVSAKIEVDPQYPQRTSVIWTQEVAPNELKIRIWERGVGETQGCGTGSSAAAADYFRRKNRGGEVFVENPGGTVRIQMDRWDAPITITGQARVVYSGKFIAAKGSPS
jgi:diaminopimelate epimerase